MRNKRKKRSVILPLYGLSAACVLGQCWETSNNYTCATSGQICGGLGYFNCTVDAAAVCDKDRDNSAMSGAENCSNVGCQALCIYDDVSGISHSETLTVGSSSCYKTSGDCSIAG